MFALLIELMHTLHCERATAFHAAQTHAKAKSLGSCSIALLS